MGGVAPGLSRTHGPTNASFTNPLWEQVRDRQDIFFSTLAWGDERFDLAQGGAVHYANGIFVSGRYFPSLGVCPAAAV
jgi:hypothetical protein